MRINRVLSNERPMCCCFLYCRRRRRRRQQPINLENTLQESIANDEKERETTKKHTNYIVREPK